MRKFNGRLHVGFTGTREGMTNEQYECVRRLLLDLRAQALLTMHSGDCVGADDEFNDMAYPIEAQTVGHPPIDKTHRAFGKFDEVRPEQTHFARNRQIVAESGVMIATPKEAEHQKFGGTWYTIDHAKKLGRALMIVGPDGVPVHSGEAWPVTPVVRP